MSLKKKRISLYILICSAALLITAGIIKKSKNEQALNQYQANNNVAEQKNPEKFPELKAKKDKFKTNDEIKKEYGKIETVTLWNGKTYTGAVINSNELYTIITIDGTIKIPMKDVKIRKIIR